MLKRTVQTRPKKQSPTHPGLNTLPLQLHHQARMVSCSRTLVYVARAIILVGPSTCKSGAPLCVLPRAATNFDPKHLKKWKQCPTAKHFFCSLELVYFIFLHKFAASVFQLQKLSSRPLAKLLSKLIIFLLPWR